jgi:hypothetical protein
MEQKQKIKKTPITYSYERYKDTVKRCVKRYQKQNREKLNEYMRDYLKNEEKHKRHLESMKRYRAKKKAQSMRAKESEDDEYMKKLLNQYKLKKAGKN